MVGDRKGPNLIGVSVSVQPGGQGYLVVHYLEGICQCGNAWQGKPSLQPTRRDVNGLCFVSSWTLLLIAPRMLIPYMAETVPPTKGWWVETGCD